MNLLTKLISICVLLLIVFGCKETSVTNTGVLTEINRTDQTKTQSTNTQVSQPSHPHNSSTPTESKPASINTLESIQAQHKLTIDNEKLLVGTISDNLPIHMKLSLEDGKVVGTYYYDKYKIDISLVGSIDSDGFINLTEANSSGEVTGFFAGWMSKQNRFVGIWEDKDRKIKLPFNLYMENGLPLKLTAHNWTGTWERLNETIFVFSHLEIESIYDDLAKFNLNAGNGANVGSIEGQTASIKQDFGVWKNDEATFIFLLTEDGYLYVDATDPSYYAGAGVSFRGLYRKEQQRPKPYSLVQLGIVKNTLQEDKFKELVGTDYDQFVHTFHLITQEKDLDDFGVTAFSGGIRGLFTIQEAFIMYDEKNHYWAALLNNGELNYYTNTEDLKVMPKTIENWRSRFKNAKINYK